LSTSGWGRGTRQRPGRGSPRSVLTALLGVPSFYVLGWGCPDPNEPRRRRRPRRSIQLAAGARRARGLQKPEACHARRRGEEKKA
jgi:hypothetical protein